MLSSRFLLAWTLWSQSSCGVHGAKSWATLPVRGPPVLNNTAWHIPATDVLLGTPPQNTSMFINIGGQVILALTPECVFCPSDGMYDPSYSSSASVNGIEMYGDASLGGPRGNETVTFGGVLQDIASPIGFIEHMASRFYPRFNGGHLGLFVSQFNQTLRGWSALVRMDEQGQLLNPVWGMRLGGGDGSLTIGALDSNDYEGEINWVPALDDQPMIHVDSFKGYNGNVLPLNYPLNASIDTLSKNIYLADLEMYMMNRSYFGDIDTIKMFTPHNDTFGVGCTKERIPTVPFSVGINGVDYPINQADLVRPFGGTAASGYCSVGISKSPLDTPALGLTFLRSVYFAYRFPTRTCPGYWGFAAPKGSPTPTQKPKATPSDAAKCLSFVTPTSTPSPNIMASIDLDHGVARGTSAEKFGVYGGSADEAVVLRGVDDLPPLKAAGGIFRFGG